tara:strand:- start:794 stop:1117 length:324 start_codon:yes stop_codon:yes gene_type:complete
MPNKSKQKGNRFERQIVQMCTEKDIPSKRAWGSNGMSLGMAEEVDVLIDSDIKVQAKVRKAMGAWMLPSDEVDLQVIKRDRGQALVVMRFDDWLNDYRRLMELEGRL